MTSLSNPETRQFRYDPGWILEVRLGIASGVGVVGLGVMFMIRELRNLEMLPVGIGLVLAGVTIAWLLLRYHRELMHDIEVTSRGLFKVKDHADVEHLLWIDVRRVQVRRLWSRLEVHGRSSRFIVGDRIENWKGLLEAIRQRTGRDVETTWW